MESQEQLAFRKKEERYMTELLKLREMYKEEGQGFKEQCLNELIEIRAKRNKEGKHSLIEIEKDLIGMYDTIIEMKKPQTYEGNAAHQKKEEMEHKKKLDKMEKEVMNLQETYNARKVEGDNPLLKALRGGESEKVVQLFASEKFSFLEKDANTGLNILHYCCSYGMTEMVTLLLEKCVSVQNNSEEEGEGDMSKININATTKNGMTALHLAAMNGHEEIVVKLLESKADANKKNNDSRTSLHLAVFAGHLSISLMLIGTGVSDVNAKDGTGRVPLHYAVISGNVDMTKMLIDQGMAKVKCKDTSKMTALNYGRITDNKEIIAYLEIKEKENK